MECTSSIRYMIYIVYSTTAFRNNFSGSACWGDFIFSELQNQFFACSSQPGQKCESGFLFNIMMYLLLQVGYCVIVMGTDKYYK